MSEREKNATVRWLIVASRFNETVVDALLEGALACLAARGVSREAIRVHRVAGAWELPLAVASLLEGDAEPVGAVALGAIIQGETPHFDYICSAVAQGLMDVSLGTGKPVAFGVLTCDDMAQALARAGGDRGNKGWEATEAALDLAQVTSGSAQGA